MTFPRPYYVGDLIMPPGKTPNNPLFNNPLNSPERRRRETDAARRSPRP